MIYGNAKPAMVKTMKTFNKNVKRKATATKVKDPRESLSNSLMSRKPKSKSMSNTPTQPNEHVENVVMQYRNMRNA